MLTQIKGLHHVTSMAADAQENNDFFTKLLGMRRVKKTVNFDAPDVYHLYYGDEGGTPGSVMTYFPFPHIAKGRRGTGEVSETAFAVPVGTLDYWRERLAAAGVEGLETAEQFGEARLRFHGPDGDAFALVEAPGDTRAPFGDRPVPADEGIRGFRGVTMRLREADATAQLLTFMGYREIAREGALIRMALEDGNGADVIDLEALPDEGRAREGAGSVHHVAFAVENREAQAEVRRALTEAGAHVTPVIDRDYFWAIYFRTPGGVLFEIATNEPGFDRDEDPAHLGEALKLPDQHAHLRARLERALPELVD
ncbi:glyoxalase family protein [Roseovarius nanhaiticus]|uniref:Glyoxalase family protein n=1 Tax=Roseovarius nanhaiticus TaxID=573024 RepID=A0A1N7FSC7_9RHOB|nr:ring-cleaving dioxygenase [Roseovarius nanhaiticus]SEK46998.1 glyoxalase family protein [Roseovarius nanhaiticus]SIS03145.1 glyoxalase family protein [Roseovarius nanhaiticus]